MAEIPVRRKAGMAGWLWLLLGLLLIGLLIWWLADDDEAEIAAVEPAAPMAETAAVGPVATTATAEAPTASSVEMVTLAAVPVLSVPGDRTFWVAPSRGERLFAVLDENVTPTTPTEGRADVNPGQIVTVTGMMREATQSPAGITLPSDLPQNRYLLARRVEIVMPANAGEQAASGANPAAALGSAGAERADLAQPTANLRTKVPPIAAPQVSPGQIRVFFGWDQADLTAEARAALDRFIAANRLTGRDVTIDVIGFADTSGPRPYNRDLSQRRARSVEAYLASKGVAVNAIDTEGKGERRPLVKTGDGVREPENRRVRIEVADTPASRQ